MASEPKIKTIGGVDYEVMCLGARSGQESFLALMKAAVTGWQGSDTVADLIMSMVIGLPDAQFVSMADKFASRTTVSLPNGNKPCLKDIYDLHFAGKYGDLTQWFMFCIEVNFGNFLGDVRTHLTASGLSAQAPVSSV